MFCPIVAINLYLFLLHHTIFIFLSSIFLVKCICSTYGTKYGFLKSSLYNGTVQYWYGNTYGRVKCPSVQPSTWLVHQERLSDTKWCKIWNFLTNRIYWYRMSIRKSFLNFWRKFFLNNHFLKFVNVTLPVQYNCTGTIHLRLYHSTQLNCYLILVEVKSTVVSCVR